MNCDDQDFTKQGDESLKIGDDLITRNKLIKCPQKTKK